MAFAYTVVGMKRPVGGGRLRVNGTFTDAAFAGSDIVTGLAKVLDCGAISADQVAIGCAESATAGTLTVKATNDGVDDGTWWAEGR
jgi:hypothetical protein